MGFRFGVVEFVEVWGLGFRGWDSGFGVCGVGFWVLGFGFGFWGLGCGVWGVGWRVLVTGEDEIAGVVRLLFPVHRVRHLPSESVSQSRPYIHTRKTVISIFVRQSGLYIHTRKTVKAVFWPWLSGEIQKTLSARKRTVHDKVKGVVRLLLPVHRVRHLP